MSLGARLLSSGLCGENGFLVKMEMKALVRSEGIGDESL